MKCFFFTFVLLRYCAFTVNHKEIVVNNFACIYLTMQTTVQKMASAPSDATVVNRIEFAFSRMAQP